MKPLIDSTTGMMTGMARGFAAKAAQAAASSASVQPVAKGIGAFRVA